MSSPRAAAPRASFCATVLASLKRCSLTRTVAYCDPRLALRVVRHASTAAATALYFCRRGIAPRCRRVFCICLWPRYAVVMLAGLVTIPHPHPRRNAERCGPVGGAGGACCEDHFGLEARLRVESAAWVPQLATKQIFYIFNIPAATAARKQGCSRSSVSAGRGSPRAPARAQARYRSASAAAAGSSRRGRPSPVRAFQLFSRPAWAVLGLAAAAASSPRAAFRAARAASVPLRAPPPADRRLARRVRAACALLLRPAAPLRPRILLAPSRIRLGAAPRRVGVAAGVRPRRIARRVVFLADRVGAIAASATHPAPRASTHATAPAPASRRPPRATRPPPHRLAPPPRLPRRQGLVERSTLRRRTRGRLSGAARVLAAGAVERPSPRAPPPGACPRP